MVENGFQHQLNRTIAAGAAALVGLVLLWYFAYLFILVFAGVLLGLLLQSITDFLSDHLPLHRGWCFVAVLVLLFGFGAGVVILFGPLLSQGLNQLIDTVGQATDEITSYLQQRRWGQVFMSSDSGGASALGSAAGTVASFFSSALWALTGVLLIFIVGIYTALEPETYVRGVVALFPENQHRTVHTLLEDIASTLRWWLLGRFSSMALVGVLTWLGLLVIGMPLAATLAILAALLSFVPNIGPVLSAIPAVLIGLQQSHLTALYVVLVYVIVQTAESYIITPLIQRKAVALPPALVVTVQLMGAFAFGTLGILVATPLTVAAMVSLKKLYISPELREQRVGAIG